MSSCNHTRIHYLVFCFERYLLTYVCTIVIYTQLLYRFILFASMDVVYAYVCLCVCMLCMYVYVCMCVFVCVQRGWQRVAWSQSCRTSRTWDCLWQSSYLLCGMHWMCPLCAYYCVLIVIVWVLLLSLILTGIDVYVCQICSHLSCENNGCRPQRSVR